MKIRRKNDRTNEKEKIPQKTKVRKEEKICKEKYDREDKNENVK